MRFTPSSTSPQRSFCLLAILLSAGLCLTGCGRAPAPSIERADTLTPAPAQPPTAPAGAPTREDLAVFLRTLLPAETLLHDLQTDAPLADSGQPGAWVINAKVTLAPKEDLFRSADEGERAELNALIERFNAVVRWRNGFAATAYGRAGVFADLPVTAPKVRPLLVGTIKAGSPLPAAYVKVRASRQVDRWRWEPLEGDLNAAETATRGSERRASYEADALVVGSLEARAFMEAVKKAATDAEGWKAGVERDYAARLREATRTGMIYRGQTSNPNYGRTPVELRFTAGPPATATKEPAVACELVVTGDPTYRFTYEGTLYLGVPTDPNVQNNLVLSFTQGGGRDYNASKVPPEVLMLHGLRAGGRGQRYILLLGPEGTITGNIAPGYFGGFQLMVSPAR